MDLIGTAWRGGPVAANPNPPHNIRSDDNIETQFPGGPWVPNMPAQLVASGYHPSRFQGGATTQVPANFGTEGSLSINDWTPTYVPPTGPDPHNALFNLLLPIRWDLQVATPDSEAVRGQVLLTQVPSQESAQFSQPGTASLTFD